MRAMRGSVLPGGKSYGVVWKGKEIIITGKDDDYIIIQVRCCMHIMCGYMCIMES
jgi:hypothetical protein